VTSEAFRDGGLIPSDYSCDGDLGSPDLSWSRVPDGTGSLVVLSLDPDANNFVHWLVYGVPPDIETIPLGTSNEPGLADGSRQGKNSFGKIGYGPLCPPEGSTHTYQFYVYALDTQISEAAGASRGDIEGLMESHILAWGVLTGTFGR
jgi:Raf kinase inhibitor-like YbhB/YbcL family protein